MEKAHFQGCRSGIGKQPKLHVATLTYWTLSQHCCCGHSITGLLWPAYFISAHHPHDIITSTLIATQYAHKTSTSSTASLTEVFCCGVSDPSSSSTSFASCCPGAALRLVGKQSSGASGHHVVAPPPLWPGLSRSADGWWENDGETSESRSHHVGVAGRSGFGRRSRRRWRRCSSRSRELRWYIVWCAVFTRHPAEGDRKALMFENDGKLIS